MDTFITVRTFGKNAQNANEKVKELVISLDRNFSVNSDSGIVQKINSSTDLSQGIELTEFEAETFNSIIELAARTNGAFNPCLYPVIKCWGFTTESFNVPAKTEINSLLKKTDWRKIQIRRAGVENRFFLFAPEGTTLETGAVGKGLAAELSAKLLKSMGIKSACLDFGGNIQLCGAKPDGRLWRVGIKNPWSEDDVAAILSVKDCAVVTSGGYERFFEQNEKKYIHIFDPETGFPVDNEVEAVTVVAQSGFYADGLSTALFVMGEEKAFEFWKTQDDFEYIMFLKNHSIIYTKGIADKIDLRISSEKVKVLE